MVDLVWCELCEDDYLLGMTGEHMAEYHQDILDAREAQKKEALEEHTPGCDGNCWNKAGSECCFP